MQQLSELSSLLQPLGLSKYVEQHILYPGQRRNQLVQALVSRLLGGRDLDGLQLADAASYDGLPEDERFARKCQTVLHLLGIKATPEELRGCSGQQEQDIVPLLQMAKLLAVMESQRALQRGEGSQLEQATQQQQQQQEEDVVQQQPDAAAGISKATQLLSTAAAHVTKLLSENVQLFPSDMGDTLQAYSDQGALVQLPQLCQQATQRVKQLEQALQQLQAAGAGDCEGAGSEQWRQLVRDIDTALDRQLQELQAFDAVYQQELSVWAGGTNTQQQRQDQALEQQLQEQPWAELRAGSGSSSGAEARGLMARNLMAAYQELLTLLDTIGTIMVQHNALQDVPVAVLQQQRDKHFQETYNLRLSASAVRAQPLGQ